MYGKKSLSTVIYSQLLRQIASSRNHQMIDVLIFLTEQLKKINLKVNYESNQKNIENSTE